ncbi:MAG: hypothetical protein EA394_00175, partial [Bacteroidia bacterium]
GLPLANADHRGFLSAIIRVAKHQRLSAFKKNITEETRMRGNEEVKMRGCAIKRGNELISIYKPELFDFSSFRLFVFLTF